MCNRFAQRARRLSLVKLIELHPGDYEDLRMQVERELYPAVLKDFLKRYPAAARKEI